MQIDYLVILEQYYIIRFIIIRQPHNDFNDLDDDVNANNNHKSKR